jgi:two-component SAPR family response regulator
MKTPTTKEELKKAIKKLTKANKKWFDTERAIKIERFKKQLATL